MNLKRIFDISVSASGLLVLSPVFAAVAAIGAVKFHGNPVHAAPRLGQDGKVFRMLKFKSLLDRDGEEKDRMTGFGHFLRSTALDELPQLVNILKGDMSFVGPRPHYAETRSITEGPFRDILKVRPGLTGPWQVAVIGRRDKDNGALRMELDMNYARGAPSLSNDLGMIIRTIPAVFRGHDGEALNIK
jgi:lipopolysaccharide/colanic/teichoic acid biosynthesis glycosyltransferase